MKKIYFFLPLFFIAFLSTAQIVNIPDTNFKTALLNHYSKIDLNDDGEIQVSEAEATASLSISNSNISDLTGIEAFINITSLSAVNNNIANLNLTKNIKLESITAYDNLIETVDLSKNTALITIDLRNNKLTDINLESNNSLEQIVLSNNLLTSIDFSLNINLTRLYLNDNLITTFDGSSYNNLTHLNIENNSLTNINMANGNNSNLYMLFLKGNSNLFCIQLDQNFTPPVSYYWQKDNQASYSDNCSLDNIVNIPDANFKAALIENSNINVNGDNEIQLYEATNYNNSLIVSNKSIADLTGIEAFINITHLYCADNQLTSIDISKNTELYSLYCSFNQLTSIDTSNNIKLVRIFCDYNQLATLDVSNNINLDELSCGGSNLFTSLDLTSNIALTKFNCNYNASLNSLNIANSNNTNITNFSTVGNPNLTCVTVDNVEFSTTNWTNIDEHTAFSTDCSLVKKLSVTSTNGSIITDPIYNNGLFNNNTVVTVTATPDEFYEFVEWTGDINSTENPVAITMDTDKNITANYNKIKHLLTIVSDYGTVSISPETSDGVYDDGTTIELTATPQEGYRFSHWEYSTGVTTSYTYSNPTSYVMDSDKTITAKYIKIQSLTINSIDGIVSTNPYSSDDFFDYGTDVELTATPNQGYQFDGWSGDITSTDNPISITMDSNKNITANFSQIPHTIDISTFATGFNSLEGIGIDSNNNVYVSEHDSGKIFNLGTDGSKTEFAVSGFYANDIVFNSNDKLFVAAPFSGKILEADSEGNLTEYVSAFGDSPYGVIFKDGLLYYVSENNAKVIKVNADKTKTDIATGFFTPESAAYDSEGNLYVTDRNDRKLLKITPDGSKTEVASGYAAIRGVAIANDIVYFTTYSSSSSKIVKYDPSTNEVTDYATSNLNEPRNLEIDKLGNMYVTNSGDGTVTKIFDENLKPQNATAGINDEVFNSTISLYPNPAEDFIEIKINNNTTLKQITVVNIIGKEILKTNQSKIDVSNLPSGMYVIKIKGDNNKIAVKKFIKQ